MAMPTFQAAGTVTSGLTSISVPWPTHQAGDIAILVVTNRTATTATPMGWNAVANGSLAWVGGINNYTNVFWRRATSNAESNVSISTDGVTGANAVIITYRGCAASGTPFSQSAGNTAGNAVSFSCPAVSTSTINSLIVNILSVASGTVTISGWTNGTLSSLTERVNVGSPSSGNAIGVADGGMASTGSTGATTGTLSTSKATDVITIALDAATAIQYTQTVSTSSPVSVSIANRVGKLMLTTLTVIRTLSAASTFRRTITAVQAGVATLAKARSLVLAASSSAVLSIVRRVGKTATATATATATQLRSFGIVKFAVAGVTPFLNRRIPQALTATALAITVTLIKGGAQLKAMTASVTTTTATIARRVGKLMLSPLALVTALGRGSTMVLTGLLVVTPNLNRFISLVRLVTISLIPSFIRTKAMVLSNLLLVQGSVIRSVAKLLLAPLVTVASVRKLIPIALFDTVEFLVSSTNSVGKFLTATSAGGAALVKNLQLVRVLTFVETMSASFLRRINKAFFVGLAAVSAMTYPMTALRTLSSSSSVAGILRKAFPRTLAAALTGTATFARFLAKVLTAPVALTGSIWKGIAYRLTAGVTAAVSLLKARFVPLLLSAASTLVPKVFLGRQKVMAAVTASAAVLVRSIAFTVFAADLVITRITKAIPKALSAGSTVAATLNRLLALGKVLTVGMTSTASLIEREIFSRVLSAGITLAGTLRRAFTITLLDQVAAFGSTTTRGLFLRALTAGATLTAVLGKGLQLARFLNAALTGIPTLTKGAVRVLALLAGLASTPSRTIRVGKGLTAPLAAAPALNRGFAMRLAAGLTVGILLLATRTVRNVIDVARRVFAPLRRRTWRA